jgi:hypothetical protein
LAAGWLLTVILLQCSLRAKLWGRITLFAPIYHLVQFEEGELLPQEKVLFNLVEYQHSFSSMHVINS